MLCMPETADTAGREANILLFCSKAISLLSFLSGHSPDPFMQFALLAHY